MTQPTPHHPKTAATGLRGVQAAVMTALSLLLTSASAQAAPLNMGIRELAQPDAGKTTVFYPTTAAETPVQRGPFTLHWAENAPSAPGNGRMIVISHGSGGSPWVHTDLARVLVQAGYVVALPQHSRDNYQDTAEPGPVSWVKRPREVSQAIDAVARETDVASGVDFNAVGVFGGSAGGHTALTLAGGQWSFSRFRDHCTHHMAQDFSSCVGFLTLLHNNWLDPLKLWVAQHIIAWRFDDDTVQHHADPRIQAAVAMVPFAADFDPSSLASPRIPLGLVIAAKDINQVPAFHVNRIRQACEPRCEIVMDLTEGGHGAMLSPLPPLAPGSVAQHLLADPPGFTRSDTLPVLHQRIALFFTKHLKPNP